MGSSGPRLRLCSFLRVRCSWPAFIPGLWLCSRWWRSVLPVPDLHHDFSKVSNYSCQGQIRAPHPPHPQPFGVSVDKILLEYRKLLICVLSMVVFHLCGQRSWVAVTETTWPPALRCSLSSALLNMFASPSSKKVVVLPALSFPASLAATEI